MVVAPGVRQGVAIAQDLARSDRWRVVLVVGDGEAAPPADPAIPLRVLRLPAAGRRARPRAGATLRRALRRIVRSVGPTLVSLHGPSEDVALLAGAVDGVPFVVSWHERPGAPGPASAPQRRMLARAAWILCESDTQRDTDLKAVRAKVSTVPPGDRQAASTARILEAVQEGRPGDGRPRLAVVTPYFAPRLGGVEQYAQRVALGLSGVEGYEVVVLTSNHESRRTTVEVLDGLTVFRFPRWVTVSNTPLNPWWPVALRRAMRDNRVDLVHAHSPVPFMADVAALSCGRRPLALTYHCTLPKGRPMMDPFLRLYESRVLPFLLRRADAVVSVSPPVADWLLPHTAGKAHLIPPGVDDTVFVPPAAPDGAAAPPPSILYVGRLEHASAEKGVGHLLEAFALVRTTMPAARLALVGAGDALDDYRRLAAKLGVLDGVEFRGRVSLEALVQSYQSASVLVLPSTSPSESFGMVLIEAMACGKPVIGSDVGGIPFVIDNGRDGYLVAPADAAALAAACLDILRAPDLGAALGQAGYHKVKTRFTWPGQVDKYRAIFDGLLAGVGLTPQRAAELSTGPRKAVMR